MRSIQLGRCTTSAINAPRAWDTTRGNGTKIAVLDSGCQSSVTDLNGKTSKGYNASNAGGIATGTAGLGSIAAA